MLLPCLFKRNCNSSPIGKEELVYWGMPANKQRRKDNLENHHFATVKLYVQLNKYQQMLISLSTRWLWGRLSTPHQADFQGNPPAVHWKDLRVITLVKWLHLASLLSNNLAFCVSWLKWYAIQITYEISLSKMFNLIPIWPLEPTCRLQEKLAGAWGVVKNITRKLSEKCRI